MNKKDEILESWRKWYRGRYGIHPEQKFSDSEILEQFAIEVAKNNFANPIVMKSVCPSCNGKKRFYSEISGFINGFGLNNRFNVVLARVRCLVLKIKKRRN